MRAADKPPGQITLVRPGALGDTLLLAPILRGLQNAFCSVFTGTVPQARILCDWAVVKRVHDYELENLYRPGAVAPDSTAVLFMKPDTAVEKGFRHAGCRAVFFLDPLPGDPSRHIVDHLSDSLRKCGFLSYPERKPFETPGKPRTGGPAAGGIVIIPGSGSRRKNWPVRDFVRVAEVLQNHGRKAWWLIGPVEEETGICRELPSPARLLRGMSLPSTAATLAAASLVIGNDSGPVHLSALLGAPTVAVFQASSPHTWAPWGTRVRTAGGNGGAPAPDEVIAAAEELLS